MTKSWTITNVPIEAIQTIKAYAAKNGLELGAALDKIAKGLEL